MNRTELESELNSDKDAQLNLLKDTLKDLRNHVRNLRRMTALLIACVMLLSAGIVGTIAMSRSIIDLKTMNVTKVTNLMSNGGSH